MPERNNPDSSALPSSVLHMGLEAVRKLIPNTGAIPDVTQLVGFPIRVMWDFWETHNQAGAQVRPAESTEPLRWRELGWIFRQGQCIAIEGKGREVRARIMVA